MARSRFPGLHGAHQSEAPEQAPHPQYLECIMANNKDVRTDIRALSHWRYHNNLSGSSPCFEFRGGTEMSETKYGLLLTNQDEPVIVSA